MMMAQRVYGLALGYGDLKDHEQLRQYPLLHVLAGKPEMDEPLSLGKEDEVVPHELGVRCEVCHGPALLPR